jgi:hypothetical protein
MNPEHNQQEAALDIDLTKLETQESERYSADVVFEKLHDVLSWNSVSNRIYGGLYQYQIAGYSQFEPNEEDAAILEIMRGLTDEQRKEIVTLVGDIKYHAQIGADVTRGDIEKAKEFSNVNSDAVGRMRAILFPKINQ